MVQREDNLVEGSGSESWQAVVSERSHDQFEGFVGVGGDRFCECVDVGCVGVFVEEEEEAVAEHGKGGHNVWVATAGFVLQQAGIPAPVVADFDAAPMSLDTFKPLGGGHAVDMPGTEVVAGHPISGILEGGRIAAYADDGLYMREVDLERINVAERDIVLVYPSVSLLGAGKRGESFSVSFAARS